MSTSTDHYFLLIARPDQDVEVHDYGGDPERAMAAYNEREAEFREQPDVEVVLLGADSLETVRKTHSHYFVGSSREFLSQLERELTGTTNGAHRGASSNR